MRTLAAGTAPLLGPDGQPFLPLPPPIEAEPKLDESGRLSPQALRKTLITAGWLGGEAPDLHGQAQQGGRRRRVPLTLRGIEDLLGEAESLVRQRGTEDQCTRVASQLCARAYEV